MVRNVPEEIAELRARLRRDFDIYVDRNLVQFQIDMRIREKQCEAISGIIGQYTVADLIAAAEANQELAVFEAEGESH